MTVFILLHHFSFNFVFFAVPVFLRRVGLGLESALRAAREEAGGSRRQFIHNVQLVYAKPFYGYHEKEQLFMKIVL